MDYNFTKFKLQNKASIQIIITSIHNNPILFTTLTLNSKLSISYTQANQIPHKLKQITREILQTLRIKHVRAIPKSRHWFKQMLRNLQLSNTHYQTSNNKQDSTEREQDFDEIQNFNCKNFTSLMYS
ncbi:hypothetical protein ABFS83_04G230600 [Erythranthe nasuta]